MVLKGAACVPVPPAGAAASTNSQLSPVTLIGQRTCCTAFAASVTSTVTSTFPSMGAGQMITPVAALIVIPPGAVISA